ncbi:MAG TPA: NAD(P)-dependent oxidoreductase [Candidatus Eremiobacteraceae bacterium]|jgi:3-hydroxyisobutyrate dehydrogenase-like beta-hydroxyacid dehydrogenase|nr:NAD(P)-dependent oxidoreductase [Candidatus Eremiobacteraceae bacterium]
MDVGLIGLGGMGTGLAKSLLRAGHHVTVFNRTRSRAEALRADGATVAATPAEACLAGIVMTMLADDAALESQVFGDGGILASLPRGGVHISCSTISVALSDRLTAAHSAAGQEFVSCPVFGRPDAAEAGRLAAVAAGPTQVIDRCKPLFESFGPKLLVVGEKPSLANVVKLTGNFLIASVLESLSEAVAFARKSGVDPGALMDFLTSTLFNAPVYKIYGGLIVEGNYDNVGFALPLGLKDVRFVLQAAEAQNVPMPIASVLRDRFLTAMARGNADKDWSALGLIAMQDAGLSQASNKP